MLIEKIHFIYHDTFNLCFPNFFSFEFHRLTLYWDPSYGFRNSTVFMCLHSDFVCRIFSVWFHQKICAIRRIIKKSSARKTTANRISSKKIHIKSDIHLWKPWLHCKVLHCHLLFGILQNAFTLPHTQSVKIKYCNEEWCF